MNVPSVKSIRNIMQGKITDEIKTANAIYNLLKCRGDIHSAIKEYRLNWPNHSNYIDSNFAITSNWINHCYNVPTYHEIKMSILNELLKGYGVEYIAKGHNAKSPAIEYINFGDTYDITLMYLNSRYIVGSWGNIVERGNYE
jgi:hypothetical protein